MAKTYIVTDIKYDTDGETIDDLPAKLEITVPDSELGCVDDIQEFISNEISNRTGFCHLGFSTTPEIEM